MESDKLIKLEIRGFQTHKDFKCLFDPEVTTIVGPSDVGKSAILRALGWLTQNSPSGSDFINWNSKQASVILTLNGAVIQRHKSASENTYSLDNKEFVSFGTDVPRDVAEALNITEDNFQWQYDSPFWLSESSGEVNRQLNRLVNLEIIDTVLAYLLSAARTTNRDVAQLLDRLKALKADRSKWLFIKEADPDLDFLNKLATHINQQEETEHSLFDLISKIQELLQQKSRVDKLLHRTSQLVMSWDRFLLCDKECNKLSDQLDSISVVQQVAGRVIPNLDLVEKIYKNYQYYIQRQSKLSSIIKNVKIIVEKVERTIPSFDSLEDASNKWMTLSDKVRQLKILIRDIFEIPRISEGYAREIKVVEDKLREELGDTCPLCNQIIK